MKEAGPQVSILIAVYNRLDLTRSCLASLEQYRTPELTTEVIVVDDASNDGTGDYLTTHHSNVRVIRNQERTGFARNMNSAAGVASGKYLCLLNNDTLVTKNWLSHMVEVAKRNPDVGVVGNKHLWPDSGKVNHAGMAFGKDHLPWHLYPGFDPSSDCVNFDRDLQIVTGACCLIPAQLFHDLGGFDTNFLNGFEDVDFCLRVRERGYRVRFCHESVIYHYGQSSPGRKDNDEHNKNYFLRKWSGLIQPDLENYLSQDGLRSAPDILSGPEKLSRPEPRKATRVPSSPEARVHFAVPLDSANSFSWFAINLALALEDLDIPVSFQRREIKDRVVDRSVRKRVESMMDRSPARAFHVKWTHYWEAYLNQETGGEVNAELFVTNYSYGRQSFHALDRWYRHVALNQNRKLALSRFCRDELIKLGIDPARCSVVPAGYSPEILAGSEDKRPAPQNGRVFLAVVNSSDNYRAGTDLLLQAFQKAFHSSDGVTLVLKDYGIGADLTFIQRWMERLSEGPRVIHLTKWQNKTDLIRLYREADFFVAPFRGEGFGMKILDAVAAGLPVIVPAFGGPTEYLVPESYFEVKYKLVPVTDGLDFQNGVVPPFAHWAECDVDDLAEKMRTAFRYPDEARERARAGQRHVIENYSWPAAARKLVSALEGFQAEREAVIKSRQLFIANPTCKITILIPTYNRPSELARCLQAYQKQKAPLSSFEIVLVDDASDYPVADVVNKNQGQLSIQFLQNKSNRGPAAARNRGILTSSGEVVLITGDDIIPDPAFVAEHIRFHEKHPDAQIAMLGFTFWHRELKLTPLMEHVVGKGGQQFNYSALEPGIVPPSYFYTSNVSAKRSFLISQEQMFSELFRFAAFEDTEFSIRCEAQGMRLVYNPLARAGHYHPMTDDEIVQREYKVGRMLTIYGLLHPQMIPVKFHPLFRWLEQIQFIEGERTIQGLPVPGVCEAASSLGDFLDSLPPALIEMLTVYAPEKFVAASRKRHLTDASRYARSLRSSVYNRKLQLAQLRGAIDEWLGVDSGEHSPVRDILVLRFVLEIWGIIPVETDGSSRHSLNLEQALKRLRLSLDTVRNALGSPREAMRRFVGRIPQIVRRRFNSFRSFGTSDSQSR